MMTAHLLFEKNFHGGAHTHTSINVRPHNNYYVESDRYQVQIRNLYDSKSYARGFLFVFVQIATHCTWVLVRGWRPNGMPFRMEFGFVGNCSSMKKVFGGYYSRIWTDSVQPWIHRYMIHEKKKLNNGSVKMMVPLVLLK